MDEKLVLKFGLNLCQSLHLQLNWRFAALKISPTTLYLHVSDAKEVPGQTGYLVCGTKTPVS